MAFRLAERVRETSPTTGTGTLALLGATIQKRTFVAGVGTGNTTRYCITSGDGINWEVGTGTVTAGTPDTLSRDTVIASSNAGAKISLVGTSKVFCVLPADPLAFTNEGNWDQRAFNQNDIVRYGAGWYVARKNIPIGGNGAGATPTVDGHSSTIAGGSTISPNLTTTLTDDVILAIVFIPDTTIHVTGVAAASGVPGGFTKRIRTTGGLEIWSGHAASPLSGVAITATASGSTYLSMAVMGVNGVVDTSNPFDPNSLLPAQINAGQSVSITTSDAKDLLLYVCGALGTFSNIGTPSGWTSWPGSRRG